jgi:hypothetical protein
MKKPPDNPEFARFTEAMRHIMGVSKATLREREEESKKKGKRAKKLPASPDSVSSSPSSTSRI